MGAASVVGEFVGAAGGGQVAQVAGGGRVGHAGLGGDVAGGGLAEPADRREDRLGGVGRGGAVLSPVRLLPWMPADGRARRGAGRGLDPRFVDRSRSSPIGQVFRGYPLAWLL